MTPAERETLIEQVVSAHRDGRTSPAFYDLDEAGREEAYAQTIAMRQLEAAIDPQGLTTTAKAVLAAIRQR